MTTTATLTYTAYLGGLSAAAAAALLASVPPPAASLAFIGVRVISDSTPIAGPTVRTIILGLDPIGNATATCSLVPGDGSGSPIDELTLTGAGSGYVVPPIITFTGGRAADVVESKEAPPNANTPAVAQAYLKVVSAVVTAGGGGYSAATTIVVTGQVKPGNGGLRVGGGSTTAGRPAVLTPTIVAGIITAVTITDPGDGYVGVPVVSVVDPSVTPGSGGIITISMGVGRLDLFHAGGGYSTPPTVVLTPLFQALFPVGFDQAAPFKQLMTTALEQTMMSPVSAGIPVIA